MKKRIVALFLLTAVLAVSVLCAQAVSERKNGALVIESKVMEVEKYGHALLETTIEDFLASGYELGDTVDVMFDNGYILTDIPFFNGYYVDRGQPLLRAYPGHTNIAVCINYGKLNEVAGVDVGSAVVICMNTKAGALDTQVLNSLVYTTDRADYASDAVFANFRMITAGNIVPGRLFRGASPVDNSYNRSPYVDAFLREAGVNGIIDLADTPQELSAYFENGSLDASYVKILYDNNGILALGMSVDYASQDFANRLAAGLSRVKGLKTPLFIHCTEGKDRAGFVSALLEGLMGATYDEIVADYMKSFENYYSITREGSPDKYGVIVKNNIDDMLRVISGAGRDADLKAVDYGAAARDFLALHGMELSSIDFLISCLGK